MKRKSEQITPNIVRSLKKNKTLGNQKRKQQTICSETFRLSQIIATKIVKQITDAAHQKIKLIAHYCEIMADNLSHMIYPQLCDDQNCQVVIDRQPQRILYDPICGFDKLITIKNDVNKNQENQLTESKSKNFGVFQVGRKRQSFSKSIVPPPMLIPLDTLNLYTTQTKSQKQNQKHQSFFRDRIYESGLPILAPESRKSQNNKISKIGIETLKQNAHQDYVFDYNGDKYNLSSSAFPKLGSANLKKSSNNVLKTVYRVIDHGNQDTKKSLIGKNITSRISNFRDMSKQIIKNPNIKSQSNENSNQLLKFNNLDGGQMIKNLLQTSLKQKQIIFKSIEKTHRFSKLL